MIQWLRKLADQSEIAWITAIALALVQAWQWVDSQLYQRYRQRLADAQDWTDEQRDRIEQLEEHIETAEREAARAHERADQMEERADALEDRAEQAEAHAEWCEERLMTLAGRLRQDSDVEWTIDDV